MTTLSQGEETTTHPVEQHPQESMNNLNNPQKQSGEVDLEKAINEEYKVWKKNSPFLYE